jgi:hypothetical protein
MDIHREALHSYLMLVPQSEVSKKLDEKDKQIAALGKSAEDRLEAMCQLNDELHVAKQQHAAKDRAIDDLKAALASSGARRLHLESSTLAKAGELAEAKEQLSRASTAFCAKAKQFTDLRDRLHAVRQERDEAKQLAAERLKQLVNEEHYTKITNVNKLQARNAELSDCLSVRKKEIDTLKANIEGMIINLRDARNEASQAKLDLVATQSALAQARARDVQTVKPYTRVQLADGQMGYLIPCGEDRPTIQPCHLKYWDAGFIETIAPTEKPANSDKLWNSLNYFQDFGPVIVPPKSITLSHTPSTATTYSPPIKQRLDKLEASVEALRNAQDATDVKMVTGDPKAFPMSTAPTDPKVKVQGWMGGQWLDMGRSKHSPELWWSVGSGNTVRWDLANQPTAWRYTPTK